MRFASGSWRGYLGSLSFRRVSVVGVFSFPFFRAPCCRVAFSRVDAMSGILNIDPLRAVVPDTFSAVEEAAVVTDEQGASRWVLEKIGVTLGSAIRAASSLSANNLQTALGMLATAGEADRPPDFFKILGTAFTAGGSSGEIEERAKRDMCAQMAEYLWRCSDRGRMRIVEGYLIFPRVAVTAPGEATAAEDLGERGHGEHDNDARNVMSAAPAASAAPKRTHEDMQDLVSELDGVAGSAGGGGDSSNLGLSAGSAKKTKPTYVTHRDKVSRTLNLR